LAIFLSSSFLSVLVEKFVFKKKKNFSKSQPFQVPLSTVFIFNLFSVGVYYLFPSASEGAILLLSPGS
jgi:hypothetical protein